MPFSLSYTALKLFRECKTCFWLLHREKVRRPEDKFSTLPLGVERAAKTYFDYYRTKRNVPPELVLTDAFLYQNQKQLDEWRSIGLRWQDKEGNTIRGAIDDLLEKDEKVIVFDYKTRGVALKIDTAALYQDQLDIYSFLFKKNGYTTADYGFLLFYIPTSFDKGKLVMNTTLFKLEVSSRRAEELIKDGLSTLAGKKPATSCMYCDYTQKRHKNII